jgi:arylsulfatase A-like enzyme
VVALAAACSRDPGGIDGVLLISVDTLRADHVGAYHGPDPTPALDRLAAEGVLVEQAYTPTPTTGPAHASLFTGLHPWRHQVLGNAVPVPDTLPTFVTLAQEQGVHTAAIVASYILHRRFGFARGFESYVFRPTVPMQWRGKLEETFYSLGAEVSDEAIRWLRSNRRTRPFLLFLHYFDPHDPYQPPAEFALPPDTPVDVAGRTPPKHAESPTLLADLIRAYRGEVRYVDAEIGRVIEELRAQGRLDRVGVIVTADHGEGLGERGLFGHGLDLHEEQVRIPLIVRGPGVPAGRRLDGAAQLEDLMPTVLAWLGLPAPAFVDGRDLLPWLRGERPGSPRDAVVGRRRYYTGQPQVHFEIRGTEKWVGVPDGPSFVYRLDTDPGERGAVPGGAVPPALRRALEGAATGPAPAPVSDAEVRRALEALGYVE